MDKKTVLIVSLAGILCITSVLLYKDVTFHIRGQFGLGLSQDVITEIQSKNLEQPGKKDLYETYQNMTRDKSTTVTLDTFQAVCSMSPDDALWRQLSHYFDKNFPSPQSMAEAQHFTQDHIPNTKVTLLKGPDFNKFVGFGTSVVLRISEKLKPSMQQFQGGSFYRVEVTGSSYKYLCPVLPHFDGTYTACCYFQPECSTIVVTLKYVNFAAFWDHVPVPFSKKVFHMSFCPPGGLSRGSGLSHACSAHDLQLHPVLGRWVLLPLERKMTWAVGNCFVNPHIKRDHWKNCLTDKRITILGDSHQQYTMSGIKKILGILRKSGNVEDVHIEPYLDFKTTHFSQDINKQINTISQRLSQQKVITKNDSILFSIGSWPTSFATLRKFKDSLDSLFQTLNSTKSKYPELRLAFWTPPSVPDGVEYKQRMRNQFGVGAMTSYIRHKMRTLDIEVLDMFNPTNIRNNENLCNAHYLCRRPSSGMENVVGEVGWSFINNLETFLCQL